MVYRTVLLRRKILFLTKRGRGEKYTFLCKIQTPEGGGGDKKGGGVGRGGIIVSDRYWVSLDGGESRSRECFSSAIGTKESVCLLLRGPEGVCSSQTISGGFFMLLRCTHWIRTFFNKTKKLALR